MYGICCNVFVKYMRKYVDESCCRLSHRDKGEAKASPLLNLQLHKISALDNNYLQTESGKSDAITDYISGQQVKATPEEVEAVQVFSKILVEDYGYPKECIQTRPQFRVKARPSDTRKEYPVDIAVFSDISRREDSLVIIVECKRKDRKDGRSQ